jgi:hypothetical protein
MNLIHAEGRVIVRVKINEKDSHTMANGVKLELRRNVENFTKTYTTISQGVVVSSDYAPMGVTIYFHHNASHDSNKIFDYNTLNTREIADEIYYFSILEEECYLFRIGDGPIQPFKGYATALRIFVPCTGILHGIEPKKMKDALYITSGEYKGKVVRTLRSCDYELIINGPTGREERYIRIRHFEDVADHEREEIIAVDHGTTKKVNAGSYLIGLTELDAKPLKELVHAG